MEDGKPRLDRIARRAHEIYEVRGGADGRNVEDWLRAEQEIDSQDEPDPAEAVKPAAARGPSCRELPT